jgi:hypothetical protein
MLDGAREPHKAEAEACLAVATIGIDLGGERGFSRNKRARVKMLADASSARVFP